MARQPKRLRSAVGDRPSKDSRVVVLAGGGLDSTLLLAIYRRRGDRVTAVHYDYGQPAEAGEAKALDRLSARYRVDLAKRTLGSPIARIDDEFLCRNALFVLAAASEFGIEGVRLAIGAHARAPYYDCSPEFFAVIRTLLNGQFGGRVTLETPLMEFTKSEIVALGRRMRVPLGWTYSCTRGSQPCGRCPSCLDREALGV